MRKKVYIAGPYSGATVINTRTAIRIWHELWELGFAPFCPHLSHFLDLHQARPYDEWLEFDNEWVAVCDYLYRFEPSRPSNGADAEWLLAESLGIPCFKTIEALVAYDKGHSHQGQLARSTSSR